MISQYKLSTQSNGLFNITEQVIDAISRSGTENGIAVVYCPHTTASITINENADPNVIHDIMFGLEKAFPERQEFLHYEGNSAAHLKASAFGASETLIIEKGKPILGQWQGIFFCEFDAPRTRTYFIKILRSPSPPTF